MMTVDDVVVAPCDSRIPAILAIDNIRGVSTPVLVVHCKRRRSMRMGSQAAKSTVPENDGSITKG